jgi:hypothetical protein
MRNQDGQSAMNNQETSWQPTHYADIVRHVPSGIHYARLRIKGKLIWGSLKCDKLLIAELSLGDVEEEERELGLMGYRLGLRCLSRKPSTTGRKS